MPITNAELRNNYYLSVVVYLCGGVAPYTANDPSSGQPWAFELMDDGTPHVPPPAHPNPYIASWDVKSAQQPTDEYMEANTSMAQIESCKAALFPPARDLERELDETRALARITLARYEQLAARLEKAIDAPPTPEPAPAAAAKEPPAPEAKARSDSIGPDDIVLVQAEPEEEPAAGARADNIDAPSAPSVTSPSPAPAPGWFSGLFAAPK